MEKKVAVIMGSDSDLPVAKKAFAELRAFQIPFEAHVMSAHRTPGTTAAFAAAAGDNGFGVLIAIAGMAAHLAGALAAQTTLPVIGVPCEGGAAGGLDALLSTVQMPPGVPVATVALGAGANAAILAAQILALSDERIALELVRRKEAMRAGVSIKDHNLYEVLMKSSD